MIHSLLLSLRSLLLILLLVVPLSCSHLPDPVRVKAERASYDLAAHCADGWFTARPFNAHDQVLVQQSLADWDARLAVDEQLAGIRPR